MASAEQTLSLEQRLAPWLSVRTTLTDGCLLVQVSRPLRVRGAIIGLERLVLEPASVTLWTAAGLGAGALASALVPGLPAVVGALLLAAAGIALMIAAVHPRRLTLLLDREGVLNPLFARGGHDDAEVEAFLEAVTDAAIARRCGRTDPVVEDDDAGGTGARTLADALDALVSLRDEGLLEADAFDRLRDHAARTAGLLLAIALPFLRA